MPDYLVIWPADWGVSRIDTAVRLMRWMVEVNRAPVDGAARFAGGRMLWLDGIHP